MPTVLVVDDEIAIRELIADLLADEGYAVTAVVSGEEAMARIALEVPDLLILDGNLPGISGWECLARLRAAQRTARLPVLMLTGAVDDLLQRRPPDASSAYLAKPFRLGELLAALDRVTTVGPEGAPHQ